ncbi:MAG: ATP-binding protein [Leptospiraceae bacterium]|nr:ATP-binding protein [Leptospiraceae bacterium]
MNKNRFLASFIATDLRTKMVFIGGPRQVGKTTLAKAFISQQEQYLNWDFLEDRELIKQHKLNPELKIIVLDEIHKYIRWRTLVKGYFDKYRETLSIIVTGSARLDHSRKGGDSLQGRYYYYRLHPFSLPEADMEFRRETTLNLLKLGGFPEPFLSKDERNHRRWQRERVSRLIYEDLRDLENVKELSLLELLVDSLPGKVGFTLSINAIKEDLEVSPNTVSRWMDILERIYYCYRIAPFGSSRIRAIKKANKLYLWDWSEVESSGARFENMVAGHLLKYCHFKEDTEGYKMELNFLRDTDGREVDFIVLQDKKPIFAVECKTGEKGLSKHISYFKDRVKIPKFYQVHLGNTQYQVGENIYILPFEEFCKMENMV